MQNRYTADIGDYGKYGLLRFLYEECKKTSFTLGINWYLVDPMELGEESKGDGKKIEYLYKDPKNKFRECDEGSYDELRNIVDEDKRNVSEIEDRKILGDGTVFYRKKLSYANKNGSDERKKGREGWHKEGYEKLKGCDIVFFDPDNGLETLKCNKYGKKGIKYVLREEIEYYYSRGKSIILYNHVSREKKERYIQRFKPLNHDMLPCLRWRRGSARDYVFILQPTHTDKIKIEEFLNTKWGREGHFIDNTIRF